MIKKAIVLDKTTKEVKFKQEKIILCLGISNFSLLELYSDESVKIQDKIDTTDKKIHKIKYKDLTNIAKKELENAIRTIVLENPKRFVNFFNNAKPIGLRRHQLDLLPMVGKKHRMAILDYLQRNEEFKSFEDIQKIEMMPDPIHIIVNRVLEEIEDYEDIKYHLFTIPDLKKHN